MIIVFCSVFIMEGRQQVQKIETMLRSYGFEQIILCSVLQGSSGIFKIIVCTQYNHIDIGLCLLNTLYQTEAVHIRHGNVCDYYADRISQNIFQSLY